MFYKVVLNGVCNGSAIVNVLHYRTGIGLDIDGLTLGGCDTLAGLIGETVVPKLLACLPTTYTLENMVVYPFHDGTFDLVYQNPFTYDMNQNGSEPPGMDGLANVAIMKFNLEPTVITLNGIKPPKRGYLAIGPLPSTWIDDTGHLTDAVFLDAGHRLNVLGTALASDLTSIVPPVVFYPIRVHTDRLIGDYKILSFADVMQVKPRRLTSFRRSRMPEK